MPLSDLPDEQQAAFRARLAQAGIDPADVVAYVGPDTHPGQLRASAEPGQSTITAHLMEVATVDELKVMTGIPDEHYTSGRMQEHHRIPEPWPSDRMLTSARDATPQQRNEIHHAQLVWLYGNSARVESYRDVINATDYPKTLPVFAAEELVITAENSPYVITGDSGHIYGLVTIYAGGSIAFEGNVDFDCQRMVKSDEPGPARGGA